MLKTSCIGPKCIIGLYENNTQCCRPMLLFGKVPKLLKYAYISPDQD